VLVQFGVVVAPGAATAAAQQAYAAGN
jgi:hypothetical protein